MITDLRRAKGIMTVAIALGVVSLFMSMFKNVITERWLKQKTNVACVPADVENSHPFIYRQSAYNSVQNDAYVKSFIEEYIRLTQNEQTVDYHRLSQNDRYDKARLSEAKWKAIEMSSGIERAANMKRYGDSSEIFKQLDTSNMGWVFLVDDLLLFQISNGNMLAIVRGEFQVTYDRVKRELPAKLWGYREIQLIIEQSVPVDGEEDDEYVNKYGLYVVESNVRVLSQEQKNKLSKRTKDYYLLEETK